MSLFAKPEYIEMILPFTCIVLPEDVEACSVTIEAYGMILDKMKYCCASYWIEPDYYDEMVALLKDTFDKTVKVTFKIKNGKVKNYKIDLDYLAEQYHDDRLRKIELLGWGFNDKSLIELDMEWKKEHGYE